MEMRVLIGGFGINFPSTDFGLTIASIATIQFRLDYKQIPITYAITDALSLGGGQRQFLGSHIKTDWFPLTKNQPWLQNIEGMWQISYDRNGPLLGGKIGQVEVLGTTLAGLGEPGRVSVKFSTITNGDTTTYVDKSYVPVPELGILVTEARATGPLKLMPRVKN